MQPKWYDQIEWKRLSLWVLLLVMVGYVVHDPGWKSAPAVIAALFAVVALEFSEFRQRAQTYAERPQIREHDRVLFQQLLELLPSGGVINYVKETNMAGFPFESDMFDPIRDFVSEWDNAAHEFIDVEVEHARKELLQACDAWWRTMAYGTYPIGQGRQSVPPEWELEQPERFNRVVNLLHDQAQEIVDRHERLVRIGTRRLTP